jgi:hypothetical protein
MSVKNSKYPHLAPLVTEFNHPSVHVGKSRVWTSGSFTAFSPCMGTPNILPKKLPYPKIDETRFLGTLKLVAASLEPQKPISTNATVLPLNKRGAF